jgi:3-hydroxyacyl-CoA dehydrogenase
MSDFVRHAVHGDVFVITIDNPPVNALSTEVSDALAAEIRNAGGDPNVLAVVIICAGRTFVAGADIKELEAIALGEGPAAGPDIHDLLAAIEDCPKAVVMAMHGTALGGGLELAMAGHYRVATPDAKMGQPEVNLGIIPGAEGSQRLPRLIPVEHAMEMIVGGAPVSVAQAFDWGLVDRLVEGDLLEGAIAFAEEKARSASHPKTSALDPNRWGADFDALRERFTAFARKTRPHQTAPLVAIEAIEAALTLPFDQGYQKEKDLIVRCLAGPQARAMIHAFFAERAVSKIGGVTKDTPTFDISIAAVIGAGTMGAGISTALVVSGIPVLLKDSSPESLDRGMKTIRANLQGRVDRGRMTPEGLEKAISMIETETGYAGVEDVDLVIEAVFEDIDLKKQVFAELDAVTGKNTILATNTSTLDIDAIARATKRPESVIGLHFFSPAHIMRLVEIVRGEATSLPVVATASKLTRKLRKVGVVVGNCRGFVGNRMMLPYMREAQFLVEEGSTPAEVDQALRDFGMAMGIFAVDDMGGIDLAWRVLQETKKLLPARTRVPLVLDKLYAMNRLGQKTGAGWYKYDEGSRTPIPDPEVEGLIAKTAKEAGIARREISDSEIVDRCFDVMINEAAHILEEGHASRAADIDVIYLTGYGFPNFRGGPLCHADAVGLDKVLERIREFHRVHGDLWAPAPLLEKLVRDGKTFADFDREKGQ